MSTEFHTPDPDDLPPERVPKYLWALFLALIRARILKDQFDKERRRFDRISREARREGGTVGMAQFVQVLTFLKVWLASLQVVVEGYDRRDNRPDAGFSAPSVDSLIDPGHRDALRRFRNTVFHVALRDHPDATAVLNRYREFMQWGTELMTELGRALVHRATHPPSG